MTESYKHFLLPNIFSRRELKYFLCCLAIYLTSICEYIKLPLLLMDDSSEELWVGEVEYKMLNGPQPGVISVVRDMLGQIQNITVFQLSTAKGFIFRSISKFCS